MTSSTTHGITVSVEVRYQLDDSVAARNHHLFVYHISISNRSDATVQLMSRHWFIVNGIGEAREVSGEGVVGHQPVLKPGMIFAYQSYCVLATSFGRMFGTYQFVNQETDEVLEVDIPEFKLEALVMQN